MSEETNTATTKAKIKYVGELEEDELKKLKREHTTLYRIDVPVNDDGSEIAVCYLKKPDRPTLAAAMKYTSSDPMKMNEILCTNCWVAGDERIKTVDELFMSASTKLSETFKIRESEIKEV